MANKKMIWPDDSDLMSLTRNAMCFVREERCFEITYIIINICTIPLNGQCLLYEHTPGV